MSLSRDEAERVLSEAPSRKGPQRKYTDEERKRRQKAATAAHIDAARACGRLHPEEFRTLYAVALEQRLAAEGF